jgi:hypothetical protein
MNAIEKVNWLNERDPFREWSVDDDVFCLHCDGVFKVQDVVRAADGCPICPVCMNSTPIDFAEIPWWREDLVEQTANDDGLVNRWLVKPIHAVTGKPGNLPARANNENN